MNVAERLQAVFVEVLNISAASDFNSLKYRGIEQWDSVAHMQLVGEIEDHFDIMLETDDVVDMSSFPRAVEIVDKYLDES